MKNSSMYFFDWSMLSVSMYDKLKLLYLKFEFSLSIIYTSENIFLNIIKLKFVKFMFSIVFLFFTKIIEKCGFIRELNPGHKFLHNSPFVFEVVFF